MVTVRGAVISRDPVGFGLKAIVKGKWHRCFKTRTSSDTMCFSQPSPIASCLEPVTCYSSDLPCILRQNLSSTFQGVSDPTQKVESGIFITGTEAVMKHYMTPTAQRVWQGPSERPVGLFSLTQHREPSRRVAAGPLLLTQEKGSVSSHSSEYHLSLQDSLWVRPHRTA